MENSGARALGLATIAMACLLETDPARAFIAPRVVPRVSANAVGLSSSPRMVTTAPQKLVTTKSEETFAEAKVIESSSLP